ncbi:MAG: serine/threonine-protein kinase [Anaerolineales bacterium]|nr:serine/threonine-protein kinase [Anaerolineales bacterium]
MLQERYRIVGPLGAGGFSSVYQARDMRFPSGTKLCAIKEMLISAADPQIRKLTIKSFEREASMLAMLNHPAIPDVSDYFTEGNRSYLVLELIRGKDLQNWLDESNEMLNEATALEWALQLCDALAYLHQQKPQSIVFRDMKPSNVMLDQFKRIRLIDFGIAKLFESGNKGTMIGTEGYSPPEQYRGEATPAGDVYALGATLHHLLTRQDPRLEPPFTFAERPIRDVNKNVTLEFESVIMRCLAYDPKERYADAMALKEAFEALTQQEITLADIQPEAQVQTQVSPQASTHQVNAAPSSIGSTPPTKRTVTVVKPLWAFRCEDEIRSKAAATEDMVFVSAYDNNLYALSAANGEFVWKHPTSDGLGSSPYVYDNGVYVGSADQHVYSLNTRNGRMNWRFKTKGAVYSSPVARFDHVFFGSDDSNVYAVNVNTAKPVWKANAFSPVRSTPFVDEERVFFGTEGGYVYCLEIASGKVKWQFQARRAVTSSPTVKDDLLVVGSLDNTVYALDAGSGWAIWRFRTRRPIVSSPAIDEGVVYIGSSDGSLYAIDLDTGRQIWTFDTGGQIASSPAVWRDAVYFGSTDGKVYSVGVKRGELRWQYETAGPVISSPTIENDIVYIGSTDHHLYAFPL